MDGENLATIALTRRELELVREALDSHEYWQLGYALPRNDGYVFLPGDMVDTAADIHWGSRAPNEYEQRAIEPVKAVRALLHRLDQDTESASE
jgi:hypothetical protein